MTARPGTWRTRLKNLAARACDAIDEVLYGRQLAIARAHQAAIDDITGRPVPYTLTPKAEAFLAADVRPDQVDRLALAARLLAEARRRYPDRHPAVAAADALVMQVVRDSTPAELSQWAQRDRRDREETTP